MKWNFLMGAFLVLPMLAGCDLTDEEKDKLDKAAIDLEKLADQIIITYPVKNTTVEQSMITVRADIPEDAEAQEVALYVDGIEIAKDTNGAPWEIQWPAYYYADGQPHSLLLKTITSSGAEVRNNEQFQVTVSSTANEALAFSDGIDGSQIQDVNELEVSFEAFTTATRYEVTDGNQTIETATTSTTLTNLDVGDYSLKYRAIFDYSSSTVLVGPWSDPATISVLEPALPEISNPIIEKTESGYEVTFSWEALEEDDTYSILLKKSSGEDSVVYPAGTENTLVISDLVMGMYEWTLTRTTALGQNSVSTLAEIGLGVFKTQLGGSRDDRASQIIASQSGGYIVRAHTSSYEITDTLQGDSDDWIIRLDELGNVVNQYLENKGGRNRYRDMMEAADGSIYIVGQDWDSNKALIVKLDSNLKPVWDSEVQYRPDSISERYDFIAVAEWDNKLYVSAVEWGRDGSSTYWDKAHLHEVDEETGAVSDAIALPSISGVKIDSIKAIIPKANGDLALIGSGEPEPKSEFSMDQGAFVITVDSEFDEVSIWENISDYHHLNVGNAIELSSGRLAVIGQSIIGDTALSSVNPNGSEHRYYESSYGEGLYYGVQTNLVQLPNNNVLAFLSKYEGSNYKYVLKEFNDNLIPVETIYLDIIGSATPYGMTAHSDGSITVLYGQGKNGYNNYDIVIERIPHALD